MDANRDEGRDAATEAAKRDATPQPKPETVVGVQTAAPTRTPEELRQHIENLNAENASRRAAQKTLTDENVAQKSQIDKLQEDIVAIGRKAELENMAETDRLREEKLDAERKADEQVKEAHQALKRATVLSVASEMDLINVGDAAAVIDLDQIPVLNGVADVNAARALLTAAVESRPHWKKEAVEPEPVITAAPGPGNPAPVRDGPMPIRTYQPGEDPKEAVARANADYREGKTSMKQMVHAYNKGWEKSPKMRDGSMFPIPEPKPSE